jgi:hypothetical protein
MLKAFHRKTLIGFVVSFAWLAGLAKSSCHMESQVGANPQATKTGNILEATQFPGTLIGVQYESWLTPHNAGNYATAEAIPVLGKYSSYDVGVIREQEQWFEDMGVDWLLLDWSNMLWMKPAREEHRDATHELEETTDLLFKTYGQLEKEGKHPPKLVIMVGLQNGPPVPNGAGRLNGIIAWTKQAFLDKPEYKDLWLYYHGKPLLTILNNVGSSCDEAAKQTAEVLAPDWTVRYMGSQLQYTHVEKCGFWSWMDAPIRQVLTYHDGAPEEVVVTPSSFPMPGQECPYVAGGDSQCYTGLGYHWLDSNAESIDHGAPYLESWKTAFESHPKFIQIHQWNEYSEQYNLEFGDDMEPTKLDACGARVCGGWGYYYMNLTTALISLYRNHTPDITVLALSGPAEPAVVRGRELPLKWEVIGKQPTSYTLQLDDKTVAENIQGEKYVLDIKHVRPGKHRVCLIANGAHTYFDLSPEKQAKKSATPLLVTSTIEFTMDFTYTPGSGGTALN